MFYGCNSLTAAPDLPATTLASYCYQYMFNGCSNINYIKMLAPMISSTYLTSWVYGVSPTGTFVKNAAATWDIRGISGIPYEWDVETVTVETAEA
jgi:hypothetical protein